MSFGGVLLLLMTPALAGAPEAVAQEAPPMGEESVTQETPVVHGVLFYSPTCPHCREVMIETLPPILARYGHGLQIVSVNTATAGGQQLYRAAVEALAVPRERIGVPDLLVGSLEIPGLLPDIADSALADAGIDWPPVPLIRRALAAQGVIPQSAVAMSGEAAGAQTAATDTAGEGTTAQEAPQSPEDADAQAPEADELPADSASDPEPAPADTAPGEAAGSESTGAEATGAKPAGTEPTRGEPEDPAEPPETGEGSESRVTAEDSLLAGALDADGRMSLVHELSVRQRLMLDAAGNGFAIAVLIFMLGVAGYAVLLATWAAGRLVPEAGPAARRDTWWMALGATGFSIYLTFLEPFVIGASCAWCLTSAVTAALILVAATPEERRTVVAGAAPEAEVVGARS